MGKKLSMISVDGIKKCEDFIYQKLSQGPKSTEELARLYILEEMQGRIYTGQELMDISANFGIALGLLSFPKNPTKKIAYVDDIYYILH